jgi:zinc finger protein
VSRRAQLTVPGTHFTLVIDDPMGNSFINKLTDGDDPLLTIETYERTAEQNEEFGLLDMKTENYQAHAGASVAETGAAAASSSGSAGAPASSS